MAHYHSDAKHLDFTPAAQRNVGELVQHAGQVGIVDPTNHGGPLAAGELGSVTIRGTVKVANGGEVFADGAEVQYDSASDTAVSTGDFAIGKCVGGATATEDVIVLLNG